MAPKRSKKKKSTVRTVKRIALLLQSDMAFDRAIARGVGDYIRSHTGWIILMDPMMEVTMEGLQVVASCGGGALVGLDGAQLIGRDLDITLDLDRGCVRPDFLFLDGFEAP